MSRLTPPSTATLRKYGLTQEMWYTLLDLQDGMCPVCEREFIQERRPCIDHEHKKGYKKMKPEDKVRCVRGLLCSHCNRYLIPKGMTQQKAYNIGDYLMDYNEHIGVTNKMMSLHRGRK